MTESDDSSDEAPSPNLNSTKSKKINVALLRFLIATNQPISLVDNKIIQSLIETLYKPYKIPRSGFFSYNLLPELVITYPNTSYYKNKKFGFFH